MTAIFEALPGITGTARGQYAACAACGAASKRGAAL
eukprot:gene15189-9708_t